MGLPGTFYVANITPAGIGDWTDGEIFRAITTGVSKEGQALFSIMPHPYYGQVAQEDIEAVITYLRTLPAIENKVPASEVDFPMNFILNTIPQKAHLQPVPSKTDPVLYGKYLITAACADCHTMKENGQNILAMEFAGGMEFPIPTGGRVQSANLTPDKTGLGN
ncbi:hypothetical protein [Rufibacter sp. XAAS-G3-1]|uniref:c-type cytochrome n=1 Tax=Rufibacter sp. XAAS-G3-1 TaxID=2729134 RepID=UPI0015E6F163|nr:hypothetical protein [Rufibacter sp. XAAS-G3-1]